MKKKIIFDSEGGIGYWEDDKFFPHPFIDTVIRYCYINKIVVYVYHTKYLTDYFDSLGNNIYDYFIDKSNVPTNPDLVVTSDEEFGKKYSSIIVPEYNNFFNEFASLSLCAKLLDQIKDRLVLNKLNITEKIKKENKPNKIDNSDEDVSKFGFSI